jgi:hypothetical protein
MKNSGNLAENGKRKAEEGEEVIKSSPLANKETASESRDTTQRKEAPFSICGRSPSSPVVAGGQPGRSLANTSSRNTFKP